MASERSANGVSLRVAALVAGFAYLLSPVTYAEFTIMPKLVVSGNVAQTAQNISSHSELFSIAIVCYLVTFVEDVVIAWALYLLLAPVNRAASLLAAWFRLLYTAIAFSGLLNLLNVRGLLTNPDYRRLLDSRQLQAQVDLALHGFRYTWSFSLIIFGIHLMIVGCLLYQSRYMPAIYSRILGAIVFVDGAGWLLDSIAPYLVPNVNTNALSITFLGELVLMLWLLIWGWKIKEPMRLPS
jgi:hypothetical protein